MKPELPKKLELTAKLVGALELLSDKDETIYWDSKVGGLGLRIRRNSAGAVTRTWVAQKKKDRRCFKFTIGPADIIGIEAARGKAKTELARIALGEDPVAERAKERHLMKALVADYLAHQAKRVRPRSYVEQKRYLTDDHFRPLHGLPVDQVKRGDVSKCVVTIERERGSATAREARGALSSFYAWCMRMGYVEANPTIGSIQAAEAKPRERVLSDAELAAVWRACGDDDFGRIVRLLALTGCRRSEIGGLAASELDLDKSTITISASRSKNGRPHTLPLMPLVRSILEGVTRMTNRDQLFGARAAVGFSAWHDGKNRLDKRLSDQVEPFTLHDIRRSVATKMADLGVAPHVIEEILGHVSGHKAGVAGVYNRSSYEDEVHSALSAWERYIALVIDRDLYAAHRAFLERGDEKARKKASRVFREAITAGDGPWDVYLAALIEPDKVVAFAPLTA